MAEEQESLSKLLYNGTSGCVTSAVHPGDACRDFSPKITFSRTYLIFRCLSIPLTGRSTGEKYWPKGRALDHAEQFRYDGAAQTLLDKRCMDGTYIYYTVE